MATGIDRDALALFIATAAEVGGVDQPGTDGIQHRHEGVFAATRSRLDRIRRCREVGREGQAGHVGMATGTDRDTQALVIGTAAEVGGVDQPGARGIQLRHEGVDSAAGSLLEGTGGRREVGREGGARHVSMATGIDRDAKALVIAAAAEVAGVKQRRAGDQRAAPIVSAYLKADLMRALELVTARDFPPDAIYLLVDHRLLESNLPILDRQDEVSLPVEKWFLRALHSHGDRTGVTAGSYDEV